MSTDQFRDAAGKVQERAVATVTECEACFTPDVCQLRGTCDHYRAELLRVAARALPQQVPARSRLPADVARCAGYRADGEWREGCEDCRRRTDAPHERQVHMMPPHIVVFECHARIPPMTKEMR